VHIGKWVWVVSLAVPINVIITVAEVIQIVCRKETQPLKLSPVVTLLLLTSRSAYPCPFMWTRNGPV
jgi:hypothetical protein